MYQTIKKGDHVYLKMSDGWTYTGVFDGTEEKWGKTVLWLWIRGKKAAFISDHLLDCGVVG